MTEFTRDHVKALDRLLGLYYHDFYKGDELEDYTSELTFDDFELLNDFVLENRGETDE